MGDMSKYFKDRIRAPLLKENDELKKQLEQQAKSIDELVDRLQDALDLIHIHPDNWEYPEELKYSEVKKALANKYKTNKQDK